MNNFLFKHRWGLAAFAVILLAVAFFPDMLGAGALAVPFAFGTLNDDGTGSSALTEAQLVAGVDLSLATGHVVYTCTLTAARVVGAPTGAAKNTRVTFVFTQSSAAGTGKGRHNLTWNAVFKGIAGWSNLATGPNANFIGKGAVSSITFITPDGTNFYPVGAQGGYNS